MALFCPHCHCICLDHGWRFVQSSPKMCKDFFCNFLVYILNMKNWMLNDQAFAAPPQCKSINNLVCSTHSSIVLVMKYQFYVISCGLGASANAQELYSTPSVGSDWFQPSEPTSQIWFDMCGGNDCMMTDPCPHPLHVTIVNHLVYVWSGCGNHSMWVWSLNHCTRASFGAKQWPRILSDIPKLGRQVLLV